MENKIRESLASLANALDDAQRSKPDKIADRELSGNKIHGGLITKFESQGIRDSADRTILEVSNNGIRVRTADIRELTHNIKLDGNLTANGKIIAEELEIYSSIKAKHLNVEKLEVSVIKEDSRIQRSDSLIFQADTKKLSGKGLLWYDDNTTAKQFIYKAPNDFWSSENIDLHQDKAYKINGVPVIEKDRLGSSITLSKLTTLGKVRNLETSGNLSVNNYIFYDSGSNRLGIGTNSPNSIFSIVGNSKEFGIDSDNNGFNIGVHTTDSLSTLTDGTPRIKIANTGQITLEKNVLVNGTLGIGINNFDKNIDLATAGPVSFQNKKFEVGKNIPSQGFYNRGDIVWNAQPIPNSYVGWICIKEGAPGQWKAFGQIQN